MSRIQIAVMAAVAVLAQVGCSDATTPTEPALRPGSAQLDVVRRPATSHQVLVLDRCDPASFNVAIGPGTCVRVEPGVTFDQFVAQLTRTKHAEQWRFAPTSVDVRLGDTFFATNGGGEVHTFTEVKAYGGGIVPFLNTLAGTPVPAPECLALAPTDFLAPRQGSAPDQPDEVGTELYQCCIHPWMRTAVHIRAL